MRRYSELDKLGEWQVFSYKIKSRTSNVTKPLFKNSERFYKNYQI